MKKLIAIDLDGTLLSSNLDISVENITAIQKAQEAGHIVMICSGRAPEDIQKVLINTPLQCPLAGSNGTVVIVDGEKLSEVSIAKESVRTIANVLESNKSPFKLYTNKGIYVQKHFSTRISNVLENDQKLTEHFTEKEIKFMTETPVESETVTLFEEIEEVLQVENIAVQKFFISTFVGKEELTSTLSNQLEDISITTSGPYNIEIMDRSGHKGNGLKVIAEHYQIDIENTVAIGDNFNDVPMLKLAGLSIAMGNGDPTVKEMADQITLTNDQHGVAVAIKKYVLNQS
ncbi:HAD family phosphatase [Anaerobacillus alkaliphilus]|uniref:HAD family phosphatase n=1 Tax=Anaerobacillus alkaliphilus TaxID=1548597 RepID=A0A4Q0VTK9_9BACI|nr:Cof-type HAD-IIB family hydrolase [Anaerobacillus alkaliphilus]RXJ01763.1 HAD family phosphatase [Anaerobacillus alkaliphilus]